MDTLTHALSGALLGRATAPPYPRADQLSLRARLWTGFWATAFPDSDFVMRFIDPLLYLTAHRGITHSVVLLPIWAAGLALLFTIFARGRYRWRAFVGICALGIGLHILGDVITAFGTMIFAPISNWRAVLPFTFIIDPYFSAIIVAGLVASAIWRQTRRPAVIGLGVLALYVSGQAVLHGHATAHAEAYAEREGLPEARVEAIPQPFSPFNWLLVVSDDRGYRLAFINLVRRSVPLPPPADASFWRRLNAAYRPIADATWKYVPRYGSSADARLVHEAWDSDALARYRHFALFPAVYSVDEAMDCVWFHDLRFALEGREVVFRYGACRGPDGWQGYRWVGDGEREPVRG